jgi:uncharacterized protein (DUF983 family)
MSNKIPENVDLFEFTNPINIDSEIICPECKEKSLIMRWTDCEIYCDDCGEHAGLECPLCNERFDHVWHDPFKVV